MEIWQIVGLALIATILAVVLKEVKRELAVQLSILTGAIIFLLIAGKIQLVVELLQNLSNQANISSYYLQIVLKIVGVAYISEFGAQICRDAGEGALASKIEIAAKVGILVLAIPILVAILESLIRLVS